MASNKFPHIFSPITIGPVTFKNRIELGPAVPLLAGETGMVTDTLINYMQDLARSGAGLVTIGDSAIDYVYGKGHPNQLNLGDYRIVPGLSRLVKAIERQGAVASIEVNHSGRFVPPVLLGGKLPIGPSPIPSNAELQFEGQEGRRSVQVHEMTQDEIMRVIGEFVTAVRHCVMAGLKMVTLHGGHGHLLMQFLSPLSNRRNDIYGGSFENRCRFAQEVLSGIRSEFGGSIAIEYRLSADEQVEGGLRFDEVARFVQAIEDKIDLVQVSYGNICEPVTAARQVQPIYVPRGINIEYAEKLKKLVSIPVSTLGGITMEMAEELLAEGKADTVTMVRNIIADKRIVRKYLRGEEENARPCIRCQTCMEQTTNFFPVICAVNPMVGRESEFTEIRPAVKSKKVVIIGGGPSGMQAALTAAERGHNVMLFEKGDVLGGNLIYASAHGFKYDMRKYLDWLIRQVENNAVIETRLNTAATAETVSGENPDAVLVAIGTIPFSPKVPGIEKSVWVGDLITGCRPAGDNVLIVGAGLTGLETALDLAQKGKSVTVADMIPRGDFGRDCTSIAKMELFRLLNEYDVRLIPDVKLKQVNSEGAIFDTRDWMSIPVAADTVVISTGFKAKTDEAQTFLYTAPDVFLIGDCANPSNLHSAIDMGFNFAYEL